MSTTMTIRVEPELKQQLDLLAQATHRSKSFLAAQALQDFVEANKWQIKEILQALEEADNSDFASDSDVAQTLNKWGVNAG